MGSAQTFGQGKSSRWHVRVGACREKVPSGVGQMSCAVMLVRVEVARWKAVGKKARGGWSWGCGRTAGRGRLMGMASRLDGKEAGDEDARRGGKWCGI